MGKQDLTRCQQVKDATTGCGWCEQEKGGKHDKGKREGEASWCLIPSGSWIWGSLSAIIKSIGEVLQTQGKGAGNSWCAAHYKMFLIQKR